MCHFMAEMQNYKGEPYPPKMLYQLLCGVARHAHTISLGCPNFIDHKNPAFTQLWNAIDVCLTLQSEGIGTNSKHSAILTKEEESCLWDSGIWIWKPPKLFRAALFTVGKFFLPVGINTEV